MACDEHNRGSREAAFLKACSVLLCEMALPPSSVQEVGSKAVRSEGLQRAVVELVWRPKGSELWRVSPAFARQTASLQSGK